MFSYSSQDVLSKYMELPQGTWVQATYIWVDGTGQGLRSKTKTLETKPENVEDVPIWKYDGSSCGQAVDENSDTYLHPVKIYPDPFRRGNNVLVLCDTYTHDKVPLESNKRKVCAEVMMLAKDFEPWFGIEQEYTLLDQDLRPFGWPKNGYVFPDHQDPFFCGVGANRVYGRDIAECHYR